MDEHGKQAVPQQFKDDVAAIFNMKPGTYYTDRNGYVWGRCNATYWGSDHPVRKVGGGIKYSPATRRYHPEAATPLQHAIGVDTFECAYAAFD